MLMTRCNYISCHEIYITRDRTVDGSGNMTIKITTVCSKGDDPYKKLCEIPMHLKSKNILYIFFIETCAVKNIIKEH